MKKLLLTLLVVVFVSGLAFSQEQWTLLNTSNSDIPSDRTISLGISSAGALYIGTPGGLVDPSHVYEYNGFDWTEMDFFSEFKNMKSSPNGHLCIASGDGVYHYDGTDYTLFNKDNSNMTSSNVSCIDVGEDGTEYIGMTAAGLVATGGLGIYNGSFWAIYNTDNSPLPVDNVISVFSGQNGVLWIGTQDAGLMKKDGDNWELFTTDNSDIPENRPTHFAQSSSGVLWIAFSNGSIATFDGTEWVYIRVFKSKDFPESNVSDMLFDADDNLWMGFASDGFAKYDGTDWSYFTSLLSPLPGDEVTGLELDSEGKLWISTQWNGLTLYDPDFGSAIDDFLSPENITIYPNPTNTNLNVEFTELTGKADLYVYNLMGQLVIQQHMNDVHFQINCSGLRAGHYILKIKSQKGNEFISRSFVKQ